ncbi:MAG: S9 family peptidase [Deltaproteobacteria bacterium]|jgi:dipeptidyl aminopeptidase/acylaminoacyl peptidase|nr:S9 family peptidase [Deltaproteobacteria bacterium]MBW2543129.1 S9 family peptidase [Deltaproteobacteria bacterium]
MSKIPKRLLLLVILIGATAAQPTHAAEERRRLTVDDLSAVKQVSVPQISPDGNWVAYAITEVDVKADTHRSDIWLTRWDGSETAQLTATLQSEHSPRWSPDGKQLAFLSPGTDPEAVDQLWLVDPSGGEPERVTSLPNGVTDFDWAPDSRRLVLISAVEPEGSGAESTPGPIVIDRLLFKRDGYGYLGKARSRLHLLDLADRSVSLLTDGPHDEIMPSFSPDGKRIAYVTKLGEDPDRHENWDILTIAPKRGARPKRVTEGDRMECDPVWGWSWGSNPAWSPDSRRIACIQGGAPELSWFSLQQVAIFSAKGGRGKLPTATLDRNTTRPQFSNDGSRVFFILEDDQSAVLASIATDGSGLQRLTLPGRTVSAYDVGPDGKIAVLSSTSESPPEISALEDGKLRPLTRANAELLASVQMSKAEAVSYPGADGTELHGLLMKPPGFREGVRYPTVLRLHGGPVAQWQHAFDFSWQVIAAQGYVVFGPNPRGSSGRGEAFQKVIFGDWGNADVPDVLAAADHLVAIGIADEKRLGVGGWSSGSMLTNYTIASDTRFRAATSGAGVSNMLAGFGTDEWWQDWEAELGLPWETPENWLRVSYPFLHADRIETPTLFLCGAEDHNVPVIHSEQMYMALKRLGVPTQLIVYPGQSHGISRPSFQRDVLRRYLAWYDQWLR